MKLIKLIALTAVTATIAVASTGCIALVAGGVAGAGGYAYYKGELKTTEGQPLEKVWAATEKAVTNLDLRVTSSKKDGLSGSVEAEGADGKRITIRAKTLTDNSTELRIRTGIIGDETQARRIRDSIISNY